MQRKLLWSVSDEEHHPKPWVRALGVLDTFLGLLGPARAPECNTASTGLAVHSCKMSRVGFSPATGHARLRGR